MHNLTRALAKVGIIALVDEATKYQEDRSKTALREIFFASKGGDSVSKKKGKDKGKVDKKKK